MHRRRRIARSGGRLRLDDEPPEATAHDEHPSTSSGELGLSAMAALDDTDSDRLPCRIDVQPAPSIDDVIDGRRRSVGRCRQSHGSSIRRPGRNFLPTYKWGFSEPCFRQHPGETWCARTTRFQSDATVHIRPNGRQPECRPVTRWSLRSSVTLMSTSCRHDSPVRRPIIFRIATCAVSGPGGPPPAPVASRVVGADRSTLSTDGDSSLRGCRPATS